MTLVVLKISGTKTECYSNKCERIFLQKYISTQACDRTQYTHTKHSFGWPQSSWPVCMQISLRCGIGQVHVHVHVNWGWLYSNSWVTEDWLPLECTGSWVTPSIPCQQRSARSNRVGSYRVLPIKRCHTGLSSVCVHWQALYLSVTPTTLGFSVQFVDSRLAFKTWVCHTVKPRSYIISPMQIARQ